MAQQGQDSQIVGGETSQTVPGQSSESSQTVKVSADILSMSDLQIRQEQLAQSRRLYAKLAACEKSLYFAESRSDAKCVSLDDVSRHAIDCSEAVQSAQTEAARLHDK